MGGIDGWLRLGVRPPVVGVGCRRVTRLRFLLPSRSPSVASRLRSARFSGWACSNPSDLEFLCDKPAVGSVALCGGSPGTLPFGPKRPQLCLCLACGGVWMQGGGLVWLDSRCLWAKPASLVLVGFHGRKGGVLADVRCSVVANGVFHPPAVFLVACGTNSCRCGCWRWGALSGRNP